MRIKLRWICFSSRGIHWWKRRYREYSRRMWLRCCKMYHRFLCWKRKCLMLPCCKGKNSTRKLLKVLIKAWNYWIGLFLLILKMTISCSIFCRLKSTWKILSWLVTRILRSFVPRLFCLVLAMGLQLRLRYFIVFLDTGWTILRTDLSLSKTSKHSLWLSLWLQWLKLMFPVVPHKMKFLQF